MNATTVHERHWYLYSTRCRIAEMTLATRAWLDKVHRRRLSRHGNVVITVVRQLNS